MATLYNRGSKVWRIQFSIGRKRPSITFRGSKTEAEALRGYIDRLVSYRKRGLRPSADILDWIRELDSAFRLELAEFGLIELGRVGGSLQDLIDYAKRQLSEIQDRTRINYNQYAESLVEHFGEKRPLASITRGDADEFRRWCSAPGRIIRKAGEEELQLGYGPASVAKRIKYAKQIFEIAIRKEWIDRNPFQGIRVKVPIDAGRRYFVPKGDAKTVIDQLFDVEDKLVFALGRYAGFRIGSEIRSLRWSNVDWEKSVMRVEDTKRKTVRKCPIFVELKPYLDKVWESPELGDFVCPRFRESTDQAFASRVKKAIKRAELEEWPDLFLNLRRTRSTEVVEQFGIKAESEWIGHGVEVSLRHYQMIEQATIDRAIGKVAVKEERAEDERAEKQR